MELDELKYQLNQRLGTERGSRTDEDFLELLQKKTHSVISKIQRSLMMEIIVCGIFVLVMSYILLTTPYWAFRMYFGILSVPVLIVGVVLVYLYRHTKSITTSPKPIRSTLSALVKLMERFVRLYFQLTMAMVPLCLTLSMLLAYKEPVSLPQLNKFFDQFINANWKTWGFIIAYVGGLAIGIYYFTKWYLRKLYGKYVDELKAYIQELDEQ